jgi:hypothetical protein
VTDPASDPITGGCLCGGVRFTYRGELGGSLGLVTLCHCSQCRKVTGFAAAVAPARASGFTITQGRDLVCEYESSPRKFRAFCGMCGSPVYSRRTSLPGAIRLRLGVLDNPLAGLKIQAHIFTDGAPAWAETDDAPRYPGEEPGRP